LNSAIEINVGSGVSSVTFSANGEYLLSGGEKGVGVWRVEDGKQTATMAVWDVKCLTVSRDGRWIAAGTNSSQVCVWDAKTFEQAFKDRDSGNEFYPNWINEVDFSPDSTRLVSASEMAVTIWDIATRKRVQTLGVSHSVHAAKYSPQGDRIATATSRFIRVYDSSDGCLLVDIKLNYNPSWLYKIDLLWFNNHLVISHGRIEQVEASTGSEVSQWPVPVTNDHSCIALPKHAEFIVYSAGRTVTFWDMATHNLLGLIEHPQDIHSIAVSPDDRFLAIGGQNGNITINCLSRISVSILFRLFSYMIHSICLIYTLHSRNQPFGSTTLHSTLGSTISSQTRKYY
jgi:WD40 repeat protein